MQIQVWVKLLKMCVNSELMSYKLCVFWCYICKTINRITIFIVKLV
jgi:hypothetical protein